MEKTLHALADLDRIVHEPARLAILTALLVWEHGDFTRLLEATGLTRGNLSTHLRRLESAGLIRIEKDFVDRTPRTRAFLTPEGRSRFQSYCAPLEQVIRIARNGGTGAGEALEEVQDPGPGPFPEPVLEPVPEPVLERVLEALREAAPGDDTLQEDGPAGDAPPTEMAEARGSELRIPEIAELPDPREAKDHHDGLDEGQKAPDSGLITRDELRRAFLGDDERLEFPGEEAPEAPTVAPSPPGDAPAAPEEVSEPSAPKLGPRGAVKDVLEPEEGPGDLESEPFGRSSGDMPLDLWPDRALNDVPAEEPDGADFSVDAPGPPEATPEDAAVVDSEPQLGRGEGRSLALHRVIADKLREDPDAVLQRAIDTLQVIAIHNPESNDLIEEWRSLLQGPLPALVSVLVDPGPRAVELRQVTPFAGVLTARERAAVFGGLADAEGAP